MAAELGLGLKLELEKLKVPPLAVLHVDHKEQTEDTAAVASASSCVASRTQGFRKARGGCVCAEA